MSSLVRRFIHDERGDMAEVAVTTSVIVLLMVVILNSGMLAYTAQAAENAANYGARRDSVAQSNAVGEASARYCQMLWIGFHRVRLPGPHCDRTYAPFKEICCCPSGKLIPAWTKATR